MFETIDYETHEDHVATVTINRPEAMNSFNSQMVEEMAAVWQLIKEDDHAHTVVSSKGRISWSSGREIPYIAPVTHAGP